MIHYILGKLIRLPINSVFQLVTLQSLQVIAISALEVIFQSEQQTGAVSDEIHVDFVGNGPNPGENVVHHDISLLVVAAEVANRSVIGQPVLN